MLTPQKRRVFITQEDYEKANNALDIKMRNVLEEVVGEDVGEEEALKQLLQYAWYEGVQEPT